MPYRSPGSPGHSLKKSLSGKPIANYRPKGSPEVRHLIDNGFQAFNAGRLSEACQIFSEKMLAPENDTTIGLTIAGAMTPAGLGGSVIEMMDRGLVDFIISTAIATVALQWHSKLTNVTNDTFGVLLGAMIMNNDKWKSIPDDVRPGWVPVWSLRS